MCNSHHAHDGAHALHGRDHGDAHALHGHDHGDDRALHGRDHGDASALQGRDRGDGAHVHVLPHPAHDVPLQAPSSQGCPVPP